MTINFAKKFVCQMYFPLIAFGWYWQSSGVEFPPREGSAVPLFTPPQSQPISYPAPAYEDETVQASLELDPSGLRYLAILYADLDDFFIPSS